MAVNCGAVIADIRRQIHIRGSLVYHSVSAQFENDGHETVTEVTLCQSSRAYNTTAFSMVSKEQDGKVVDLPHRPIDSPTGTSCIAVEVSPPLASGATARVETYSVHSDLQTARPAAITQLEPQCMLYEDLLYAPSPYTVRQQSVVLVLPGPELLSFTPRSGAQEGDTLTWGPFSDTPPFTLKPLTAHYPHMKPLITIDDAQREIEVSHWGNIYVEEDFNMRNSGALLSGGWSRIDFEASKQADVHRLQMGLPATAHRMYFRDTIGNISSSDVRPDPRGGGGWKALLALRHPLAGGWRSKFRLGYSLPLSELLVKNPDGSHTLSVLLPPPLESDYSTRQLEVRVVLPEGAHDTQVVLPNGYEVDVELDRKQALLSIAGRPVVVLRMRNQVPAHRNAVLVHYRTPWWAMLQQPALLVLAFLMLFAAVILWTRADFSISDLPDPLLKSSAGQR